MKQVLGVLAVAVVVTSAPGGVWAQQADSRLYQVTKAHRLRVCEWPAYYAITFRNPKTGQLDGIDAELSREFAKDLGAEVDYVDTSFATFAADLNSGKCEIAMFGVGATMRRAQAVAFSEPYLVTSIYAVVQPGGRIKQWADIDKKGVTVALNLGSYVEPAMRAILKNATINAVTPPATMQAELITNRADVIVTDLPTALKMKSEFGTETLTPPDKLAVTPYAYAVPQGDQIWLNYVNQFVQTIKLDGRLAKAAERNGLGPIVAR